MTETKSLLIELGTEELPVKALPGLAQAFFDGIIDGLAKRGIAFERGAARPLYTPRRLAVLLPAVAALQPAQRSEVLGPYLNIALDADGQPTRALQGFASKSGVDWTRLERTTDAKGERFVHRAVRPGAATAALLPAIVNEAIAAMPIPKPMRWGDHTYAFARPAHWLVMLLGEAVVAGEALGIRADRLSRGHRFMHAGPVRITRPEDYVDALRGAKVLVDPDERRERIVREVERAAGQGGGTARIADDNLEQVNCLVEWPVAVLCDFERDFIEVPAEALIATMEANQKFFPVLDGGGGLTERFVGVANIESKDTAEIRKGYERVIRPRFADARFFFDEDNKQGLTAMGAGLASVTYQAKLGNMQGKVMRVATFAQGIAALLDVDQHLARRAAELSKNDLQSRLVNEFPELQGIAGRHYAMQDHALDDLGYDKRLAIANAIDEAYMPRYATDAIAPSDLGRVLAVAERLYVLAGGFYAGLQPTGNKDPFALRRAALGLARTLIEGELDLSLDQLLFFAVRQFPHARTDEDLRLADEGIIPPAYQADVDRLREFILDRLRGYYADRGVPPQHFEAVASTVRPVAAYAAPTKASQPPAVGATEVATAGTGSLLDFDRRLRAIGEFAKLPEAAALAAANKRIRNILRKAGDAIPDLVNPALFAEPAERDLSDAVDAAIADTDDALAQRDYVAVLGRLARLRPQVDVFFDAVLVMADDAAVRRNRLALLKRLADRFGSVAAIEHLST